MTLGALAELEAAFDVASLADLGERLTHLTASELLTVISALTIYAEHLHVNLLSAAKIDPKEAAAVVAEAFRRAFDA